MDIVIKNCRVITGDGVTNHETGTIYVRGNRIEGVEPGRENSQVCDGGARVIDATGFIAIPGVINGHCHGCTTGPLFPSGSKSLTLKQAVRNTCVMLRQGVTTLVNMCGMGSVENSLEVDRMVPVKVRTGTGRVPSAVASAMQVDGQGLSEIGDLPGVEKILQSGAVAIGEMGSGASLGGGVTEYKFIPQEVKSLTGATITAVDAREIKEAVVGRQVTAGVLDSKRLEKVMKRLGLADRIPLEKMVDTVERVALKPVELSLKSFDEAFEAGQSLGAPLIFHNSIVSAPRLLELCRKYENRDFIVVAGHSNHPSFTPEEAVKYARALKQAGAVIDVSTLDCIVTRWMNGPENIEALAREGLIDTFSTDYGGGHWDGILEGVHYLVNRSLTDLPRAVAMATGNVTRALPLASPGGGFLKAGAVADIVLSDPVNPGRVEMVIIDGKIAYDASVCKVS